jgi:hypothetical protein
MTNTESARVLYARTEGGTLCHRRLQCRQPGNAHRDRPSRRDEEEPGSRGEASHGEVEMIGLRNLRAMVDSYKAEFGIEMYINLDHSPSVKAAKAAIDAGFEFIHIDLSQAKPDANNEEIITATREVVEYAKTTGACLESEPHYFGGSSNVHAEAIDYAEIRKTFTTPDGARPSWRRLVSIPSPWPLATCMACTRCPNIST